MAKYVPPGFNSAKVIDGLHKAMGFGEPTRDEDKVTFCTETVDNSADLKDQEDVPFDLTKKREVEIVRQNVYCAVEYSERTDVSESFGVVQPDKIEITLLDPDYQLVKGFSYVVAGGDQYFYKKTEPPVALGPIDVWTIHCTARDER